MANKTDREIFNELHEKWREETMAHSSTTIIYTNENYMKIIGMGQKALGFIFEELNKENGHWFMALRCITRENPADDKSKAGNMEYFRQTWLEWAKKKLYFF